MSDVIQQPTSVNAGWVAVFDLNVTKNSPAGSCVLEEVIGLSEDYEITVFSDKFDQPESDKLHWVRIPLPSKPGIFRYIIFYLLAPLVFKKYVAKKGSEPVFIQGTQGQFGRADLCYAHFCHRAYMAGPWKLQKSKGVRRLLRYCNYRLNAFLEKRAFLKAKWVVAPSLGLVNELLTTYPFLNGRISQIPNPVDVDFYKKPTAFDLKQERENLGFSEQDKILCFAALGDFERKGLGLIIRSLAIVNDPAMKLMVVGGGLSEIEIFRSLARECGVLDQVTFVGFQKDVRSYMWISNVFLLPSSYETFALVVIQAMAAGLPAIVTKLHGVEEYAVNGENCWVVDRSEKEIARAIVDAFLNQSFLASVAKKAETSSEVYRKENFVLSWRKLMKALIIAH